MKLGMITVGIAALLAAAGWWLLAAGGGVPVQTAPVETGPISEFVDEQGKTRLPDIHKITMPFTGRIAEITLREGDAVTAASGGDPQIVARLVPLDLQLSVDAAQAAVDRLAAAIEENDDVTVERTGLEQAVAFVASMDHTVEAARARVEAGERRMEFAEVQLGRIRRSFETGAVTQEELDRADVSYVEARVDVQQDRLVLAAMRSMQTATSLMPTMVRQYIDRKDLSRRVLEKQRAEAEAELAKARENQRRGVLTSPVDGVVLRRHVSDERFLNAGELLLEIGRLDRLQVEVEVLSQDVVKVRVGNQAEIYGPAIGSEPARATVSRIHPAGFTKISSLGVEQQRVLVVLDFSPEDLQRLRDQRGLGVDYRVRARIFTDTRESALVVPRSALFRGPRGGDDWQVFVIRNGAARLQSVRVGLMNDEQAEIVEGLAEAERVIPAPDSGLTDGARVRMPAAAE